MVAFWSTVQKYHQLFCAGSLEREQILKLESVMHLKRKKVKCYVMLNEMGATIFNSR